MIIDCSKKRKKNSSPPFLAVLFYLQHNRETKWHLTKTHTPSDAHYTTFGLKSVFQEFWAYIFGKSLNCHFCINVYYYVCKEKKKRMVMYKQIYKPKKVNKMLHESRNGSLEWFNRGTLSTQVV